jgi:hypothetical protein
MFSSTMRLAGGRSLERLSDRSDRSDGRTTLPPSPGRERWTSEVTQLGRLLREKYGPYLVVSARSVTPKSTTPPLVYLGAILEAVGASDGMKVGLSTCEKSLSYIEWVNDRMERELSPRNVERSKKVCARHGLDRPIYLCGGTCDGHSWASNALLIDEYVSFRSHAHANANANRFVFSSEASNELMVVVKKTRKRIASKKRPLFPGAFPGAFPGDGDGEDVDVEMDEFEDAKEEWHSKRKRRSLPAAVRMAVWNRWFGFDKGVGQCKCCDRVIYQQDFECGHVVAHSRGGPDTVDNLRPICRTCNRSMGDRDFNEFKNTFFTSPFFPPK